jgi:hypothetical protein
MPSQSFHPRLIITDHFDDIINQIDTKTETLFLDQCLTEGKRIKLNEIRDEQIEKIKEKELKKLIHFDCVLLEQPKNLNDLVLWITFWFYNQQDLEFLR